MFKVCVKCGEKKPLDGYYKNKGGTLGRRATCKVCGRSYNQEYYLRNQELYKSRNRATYHATKEMRRPAKRAARLRRLYGMTQEEYNALLVAQGGKCAVCQRSPTDAGVVLLDVDHDHGSGAVRGLLCGPCNRSLGLLQESSDVINNLAAYVAFHKAPQVRTA